MNKIAYNLEYVKHIVDTEYIKIYNDNETQYN